MGLQSGKINYVEFDLITEGTVEEVIPKLANASFQSFGPTAGSTPDTREQVAGFVSVFDHSAPLTAEEYHSGGNVYVVAIRRETRRVPGRLLAERFRAKVAERESQHGRRMTRAEKEQIKEALKGELILQALPTATSAEVVIDLDAKKMFVFTSALPVADCVTELVHKMLGVKIRPITLGPSAAHFLSWLWWRTTDKTQEDKLSEKYLLGSTLTFKRESESVALRESGAATHSIVACEAASTGMVMVKADVTMGGLTGGEARFNVVMNNGGDGFKLTGLSLPASQNEDEDDTEATATLLARYASLREVRANLMETVALYLESYANTEDEIDRTANNVKMWALSRLEAENG